jgi:hypothetical protein
MGDLKGEIVARMRDEIGTIDKEAPEAVALVYPSPYRVAMSSLGYQRSTEQSTPRKVERPTAHFCPMTWQHGKHHVHPWSPMRSCGPSPITGWSRSRSHTKPSWQA